MHYYGSVITAAVLAEYDTTRRRFLYLRQRFLAPNIPSPPVTSEDYVSDVQSFSILAIARFEQFIELCANQYRNYAVELLDAGTASLPAIALAVSHDTATLKPDTNDLQFQIDALPLVVGAMKPVANSHGHTVYTNHGASARYIKKLLTPIAVAIPANPSIESSLSLLCKARHESAHLGLATVRISAEDARDYSEDIEQLAEIIMHAICNVVSPWLGAAGDGI